MAIEDMVLQDSRKSIRTDAGQEGYDEACKEGDSKIGTSRLPVVARQERRKAKQVRREEE